MRTSVIVETNLMRMWIEGPAVSLNGSPTVSPVTAALLVSDPLPPNYPVSINFFALSHAPPPLVKNNAIKIPVDVENIKNPAVALAPNRGSDFKTPNSLNNTPQSKGERIASSPGFIISLYPAFATIETQVV